MGKNTLRVGLNLKFTVSDIAEIITFRGNLISPIQRRQIFHKFREWNHSNSFQIPRKKQRDRVKK